MNELAANNTTNLQDNSQRITGRSFWTILAIICVAGFAIRLYILDQYVHDNPFSTAPLIDAKTYWDWSGRIAAGQLQLDTPFFSAPLYPYVLGSLRAFGASLTAILFAQIVFDVITAVLLARVAGRRFGNSVGLASAILFLMLSEPASASLRILPGSMQLLLVTLTWSVLVSLQEKPTLLLRLATGILIGLLCLAYPPALLLVIAIGPWIFLQSTRGAKAAWKSSITVIAAMATIAPATIHNWLACREFIPISAHAGITLYQGNAPSAVGGYTTIPGISKTKERMHADAARIFEQETGRKSSWREVDSYFTGKTWERWQTDTAEMLTLTGRKIRWLLTGRVYGDIYMPVLEVIVGFGDRLRFAPIFTPWIFGPALIGLLFLLRRPVHFGPELMLLLLPAFIVTVFWYSPRYRLPIIPVATAVAALACIRAIDRRRFRGWLAPTVIALLLAMIMGPSNRRAGFDTVQAMQPTFLVNLGGQYEKSDLSGKAIECYEQTLRIDPGRTDAMLKLARLLTSDGRFEDAIKLAQQAVKFEPNNAWAHSDLGMLLLDRDNTAARYHLRKALELDASLSQTQAALATLEPAVNED